jgi:hypothetical protein
MVELHEEDGMDESTPKDNLMDSDPGAMLATLQGNTQIMLWSDEKKKDFVKTFADRTKCARYILEATAFVITVSARNRKFLSDLHIRRIYPGKDFNYSSGSTGADRFQNFIGYQFGDVSHDRYSSASAKIGGRTYIDLYLIAEERGRMILDELPALKAAVKVIDAETARKIDQRDKLLVEGEKLAGQLDELNEPVSLEELDQKMTIGELRKFTTDRDRKRKAMIARLNEVGKDGTALEDAINKKLYRGLPGLTEAVVEAIKSHMDRSKALDEMTRRVGERVQYGDSAEAMAILEVFEKDEAALPRDIRGSIQKAMQALKLSKKSGKELKAAK